MRISSRHLSSALALSLVAVSACGSDTPDDPANGSGGTGAAGSGGTQSGVAGQGSGGRSSSATGNGSGGTGGNTASSGGRSGGSGGAGAAGSGGISGDGGTGSGGIGGGSGGASGNTGDSDILEPNQGALLGMFYGDDSIAETTTKLGRALPVHLTYFAWHDAWERGAEQDLDADRIPLVNWEPYEPEMKDIVSGMYDDMIRERASGAKALNKKFFLDFGAEMNGDWSPWGGSQNGMSPDTYIAAYRHVHDIMVEEGATNIVWLWCPNVTDEPSSAWNETLGYYPGDEYVDWTCVDGYNWGSTNGGWQSFQDVFTDVYEKLATKNKPIMIGEMASAEAGGDKAEWIDGMIPALRDDFPMIKGVIWFDINKETDWRISSSTEAEAAFKKMANDAYFNP